MPGAFESARLDSSKASMEIGTVETSEEITLDE